jgi:hypothetical protein
LVDFQLLFYSFSNPNSLHLFIIFFFSFSSFFYTARAWLIWMQQQGVSRTAERWLGFERWRQVKMCGVDGVYGLDFGLLIDGGRFGRRRRGCPARPQGSAALGLMVK